MATRIALFIFLNFLAISCQTAPLRVRREFLSRERLASFIVETPDPNLTSPPIGESLVVSSSLGEKGLSLKATLRFMNGEEEIIYTVLKKINRFDLINENYFKKGGIRTYKLEVLNGAKEQVTTFYHPLFKELPQTPLPSSPLI
jgi:hypothetical protein